MKYLVINGSPHKGNTWKLGLAAMEMLRASDKEAQFETVHLAEAGLPFCIGCSNCFRRGHEFCPHFSVIGEILKKMEEADGVIVLSSSFNLRETALLKNLFDHLCFLLHRPRFFQKKALVLTTTGGVGAKNAAKSITSFLAGIGFNRCYLLGVTAYSWNDYKINPKTEKRLQKVVRRFRDDVASKKLHSPTVLLMIPYNLFRGMSIWYAKGTPYETYDGVHWTDEVRKNTLYDPAVPVPFYKRPFGCLFYWLGKVMGKRMEVTYKK